MSYSPVLDPSGTQPVGLPTPHPDIGNFRPVGLPSTAATNELLIPRGAIT
ncbi:MAG: hypothetical protein KDE04_00190 [Anaerolineales bacterium]|nr:hypothetical protein [Anaerolineales bacterium]